MTTTTTASRRVHFDDLLDIPAANDVDCRARPTLRAMSRWTLRAAVSLTSEDALYADLSYEVSTGGVFVATIDVPPIGARVDLTLTLPDGRELALGGVVRWIRDAAIATDGLPPGCGVEWKGLPLEALDALAALAVERAPILWLPDAA